MHCVPSKKSYALASAEADEATLEKIDTESKDPAIYQRMAASIAPEIFGHEDIKKALMLLLVVSLAHATQQLIPLSLLLFETH